MPSQGFAAVARVSPPATPKICLPLAACSPKAREPVPELAAACWDGFPQDHPSRASWQGRKSTLFWGTLPPGCREGAARGGPAQGRAQHLSARTGSVLETLVTLGCPHQMLFIRVRVGPSHLPSGGPWWQATLRGVKFWMARDRVAKRCLL